VQNHERIPTLLVTISPSQTTIDSTNGIIDIDVPLPSTSPSNGGVVALKFWVFILHARLCNGMEGFEHYSRAGPDADTTMNVGGWMPRYNPDFALQAVPTKLITTS